MKARAIPSEVIYIFIMDVLSYSEAIGGILSMKWKDIPDYEGHYKVSDTGLVKSVERKVMLKTKDGKPRPCIYKSKILKLNEEERPYGEVVYYVVLSKNGKTKRFYVHRLVAISFLSNENKSLQINHKDGNPKNNNVSNLEWATSKENIQHAFKNNLISTKKPVQMLDSVNFDVLEEFESESDACRAIGAGQGQISRAIKRNGTCKGYRWKYK